MIEIEAEQDRIAVLLADYYGLPVNEVKSIIKERNPKMET